MVLPIVENASTGNLRPAMKAIEVAAITVGQHRRYCLNPKHLSGNAVLENRSVVLKRQISYRYSVVIILRFSSFCFLFNFR